MQKGDCDRQLVIHSHRHTFLKSLGKNCINIFELWGEFLFSNFGGIFFKTWFCKFGPTMQNASVLSLEILRKKIVSGHTSITENPWI
jgi:hypothetical protein